MGVSYRDAIEGGIISTAEFQHWLDEARVPTDQTLTSGNQIARHISNLREKLQLLTGGAIDIETEGNSSGTRGYFLKASKDRARKRGKK